MEEFKKDKIITFDTYFSEPHIQMLKILFSYIPPCYQKHLALYIKLMELKIIINTTESFNIPNMHSTSTIDPDLLCRDLLPLCNETERKKLDNIMNLLHTMNSYKDILEMMNTIKDFFPDGMNMNNMDEDIVSQMMGMFAK